MRGIYQTRITKGQALTRLQDNEPVLCVKHLNTTDSHYKDIVEELIDTIWEERVTE